MTPLEEKINKVKERFSSSLEELKEQVGRITFEINEDALNAYREFDGFDSLYSTLGVNTIIIFNEFESYSAYKSYFRDLTSRVISELKDEIKRKTTLIDKREYILEITHNLKQVLKSFDYPISTDIFAHHIMQSPHTPPLRYKLEDEFITQNHLEDEVIFEIEHNCFENYIRIQFNGIAEIISNMEIQNGLHQDEAPSQPLKTGKKQKIENPVEKANESIEVENELFEVRNELLLPENVNLPEMRRHIDSLTLTQTVLLFHYCKQYNVVLPYNNSGLGTIISSLTGYSKKNIKDSFGELPIKEILEDSAETRPVPLRNQENANFKRVVSILKEIIEELENQMERNKNLHSK